MNEETVLNNQQIKTLQAKNPTNPPHFPETTLLMQVPAIHRIKITRLIQTSKVLIVIKTHRSNLTQHLVTQTLSTLTIPTIQHKIIPIPLTLKTRIILIVVRLHKALIHNRLGVRIHSNGKIKTRTTNNTVNILIISSSPSIQTLIG